MKRFLVVASCFFCVPAWAQNSVSIHVVDAQKAPIAGAMVEVSINEGDAWITKPGETNEKGDVTLDLPYLPEEKKPIDLWLAAKGFAFSKASLRGAQSEVTLQKGSVWRGKVVDEAGKPIEGARVIVEGSRSGDDWRSGVSLYGTRFAETNLALSGTDGDFEIADVPNTRLLYSVTVPGFAIGQGVAAAGIPASIALKKGAILKGRVLGVDGTPLAKVHIFAQGMDLDDGYGDTSTAADGTYQMDSLAAGLYNIMVFTGDDAPYVVAAQENILAEKGKTLQLPDFRAIQGVLVGGVVRDAVTHQGIAGVGIGSHGPNRPDSSAAVSTSKSTLADGKFTMRVVPGKNSFYFYQVPQGYPRPNEQKELEIGTEAPPPLLFELKAVAPMKGTIVDEAGKPIVATVQLGYDASVTSKADGSWEYMPTQLHKYQLSGGDGEDSYFELISPREIDPTVNGPTRILVRKKAFQVLPGRVLKTDGTPLEGVQVTAEFFVPQGEGGGLANYNRKAVSNANGDFELPQIRAGSDAKYLKVKAQKAGYAFQKGGEITDNGPVRRVSDLIFAATDRKIAGVTEAGAHVVVAGHETVAGADGKFAFEGLPADNSPVFATRDGNFGSSAVTEPLRIELHPQTLQGVDEAMAREIWADVVHDAAGKNFYSLNWVQMKLAAGAETFEAQLKAAANNDSALIKVGEKWAGQVDVSLIDKAFAQIKDPDSRVYAYLGAAMKANDPALTTRAFQEAEALFAQPEKEVWWRELNLYKASALAAQSGDEQAGFAALDRAVAFTLKNHGEKSTFQDGMQTQSSREDVFAAQASVVAGGSKALFERLMSNIEPGQGCDIQAIEEAIPVLARKYGVEAVLPMLDDLAKMPKPKFTEEYQRSDRKPDFAFAKAATLLIPSMGQTPDKARELALRVQDNFYRGRAMANAARLQPREEAGKLWRQAVETALAEEAPLYAALAWNIDPKLGEELFGIAKQRVESESKQQWRDHSLWPNYAFYYARVNPGEARLILEREWGLALQQKKDGSSLGSIARAMSAIDGARAVEMARSIQDDTGFWPLETRRKIGQYLAATQKQRLDWPFPRWGATDTWDGTEE